MSPIVADLRFAWRSLAKRPGLAALAVAALALGIGANTAIWSVARGVLFRPLPYPEPDRIIRLLDTNPTAGLPRFPTAPPDFADWRAQNRSFSHLAAVGRASLNLTGQGEPERLVGAQVSADFFGAAGVPAALGRALVPADDALGSAKVAVLSRALWQRRFGADPRIVGRRILLNGEPTQVVGVMPERFDLPQRVELWVPMQLANVEDLRGAHYLSVVGRLRPGVSPERAQAEMSAIADRIAQAHPETNKGWGVKLVPLHELMIEDIRPALVVLLAAVGLVLLIACANVANLLLSRLAEREREVAVRAALGASRGRLIRQFLTESTLLALVGGVLGILLAWRGTSLLVALFADRIPRAREIALDATVLSGSLALSLATGLAFGLLPALHSSRSVQSSLREGGKGQAGDRRGRRTRRALVFAEVALAVVLLFGAGLMIRSLGKLARIEPGFRAQGVLTAQIQLPEGQYKSPEKQEAFYRALLPRLAATGARSAALGFPVPFSGARQLFAFQAEGRPALDLGNLPATNGAFVTPTYFSALGIPLLSGRNFDDRDRTASPPVIIVNRKLADEMWPGENPIGKRLTFDVPNVQDPTWQTVIGVVGDVRTGDLAEEPGMQSYQSILQVPTDTAGLLLSTEGDPAALGKSLAAAVREVDPSLPIANVKPLEAMLSDSVAAPRANAVLLGLLAAFALVLAAVGVYGVLAYSVAQRTREIGLRMALGAGSGEVLRQILREGLATVGAGIAAGALAALGLGRVLESLLFGITARDPLTLVAMPIVLLAVSLIAIYLPARRATRVEPVVALRYE